MALLPTRADIFVSRVLHILSSSLLVGAAFAPYLIKDATPLRPWPFIALGVVSLLTGGYNYSVLKVKTKLAEKAGPYRIAILSKIAIWLLMTPLLEKLIPASPHIIHTRAAIAVAALIVGAYLRFYREKHTHITNNVPHKSS